MQIRLLRDLYRYDGDTLLVFAKKGQLLESGPLSEKVDWLVGCKTAALVTPLDNGRIRLLGEGTDFECVEPRSGARIVNGTVDLRPGTRVIA